MYTLTLLLGKTLEEFAQYTAHVDIIYKKGKQLPPESPHRPTKSFYHKALVVKLYVEKSKRLGNKSQQLEVFLRLVLFCAPELKRAMMYMVNFYKYQKISRDSRFEYFKYRAVNYLFYYPMMLVKLLLSFQGDCTKQHEEKKLHHARKLAEISTPLVVYFMGILLREKKLDLTQVNHRIPLFHMALHHPVFASSSNYPIKPTDPAIKKIIAENQNEVQPPLKHTGSPKDLECTTP